jgi:uncharacterized phage-like protein YoqJ
MNIKFNLKKVIISVPNENAKIELEGIEYGVENLEASEIAELKNLYSEIFQSIASQLNNQNIKLEVESQNKLNDSLNRVLETIYSLNESVKQKLGIF